MTEIPHVKVDPQDPIFSRTAPAMWERGLQVIPLQYHSKRPIPNDWSRFASEEVSADQQKEWLQQLPTANIGLVLGQASGVTMLDIDTEDPELEKLILSRVPHSPWLRHGKKGSMTAFKFSGLKTFRIKNLSGETIVECLSSRTQCVVPPSIHPDTGQPYRENVPLIKVLHTLLPLPDDIEEILRKALTEYGIKLSHSGWSKVTEYVPAGSRDTTLTELAGLFAFAILRGERTLLEAISMLRTHHANYVENVAGDQVGVDKHIANMIKFLHRDVQDRGKVLPPNWDAGLTREELDAMGVTLGVDETEWEYEALQEHLQMQFEAHPSGKARAKAVDEILKKIANSRQLSNIDESRIINYIKDTCGMGLTLATLRAQIRELRQGDVVGTDHSELARAVLSDLSQYSLIRWSAGRFMKWAGAHWIEMDEQVIFSHISTQYGHLPAAKRASDMAGIVKVMRFIAEQNICRKPVTGINFANGFLTEELKLLPHEPDFGMTYVLPFRYMPEEAGKFPLFAAFLNASWGGDSDYHEKMQTLQEAMAVTMFGLGSKYQRAILLQGAPRTGKTQMLRIIETLVPNEAKSAVSPDKWHDKFLPTMMHGKILNICGELSSKRLIDGQNFKDVIDGSEMHGQFKGQQIFKFKPLVTHWFASNHIPKSEDTSMGFIRRWVFLTFNQPVREDKVITDLGDLISAQEREAIVSWAAQAITRLRERQRYTLPPSHLRMMEDFANLNNSVRFFLKESGKIAFRAEKEIDETSLYNQYWTFCSSSGGVKPVGLNGFREHMRELCSELTMSMDVSTNKMGMSQVKFLGIGIKT